jgi:hypothetical protein
VPVCVLCSTARAGVTVPRAGARRGAAAAAGAADGAAARAAVTLQVCGLGGACRCVLRVCSMRVACQVCTCMQVRCAARTWCHWQRNCGVLARQTQGCSWARHAPAAMIAAQAPRGHGLRCVMHTTRRRRTRACGGWQVLRAAPRGQGCPERLHRHGLERLQAVR